MPQETTINTEAFGTCPLPITRHDTVQLSHGSGGKMMNDLIRDLFVWAFNNPELSRMDDCARLDIGGGHLAFSTDTFVVDPIFFPGGNIGELAVNGTVNDVATSGARPKFLSVGVVLEEGLPLSDLKEIVVSMRRAADAAGVRIVTGDTKVVNKGKADQVFINTTGVGTIDHELKIGADKLKPGDHILLSGSIADHGMAILSQREGLRFETPIMSDTAPLNGLIETMLEAGGDAVHALRDPTRGGLAASLNEFASSSQVQITIEEAAIPVKPPVSGACEFLGLDPLYVANEGKLVAAVSAKKSDRVVDAMRAHEYGRDACIIGKVMESRPGLVTMRTRIGGNRIVDMMVGEQLPRIC
jgi:hydrogenase expression/formation protein HypE